MILSKFQELYFDLTAMWPRKKSMSDYAKQPLVLHLKRFGRGIANHCFHLWNIVDWISFVSFIYGEILWIDFTRQGGQFDKVGQYLPIRVGTRPAMTHLLRNQNFMRTMADANQHIRMLGTINIFLAAVKLFEYLQFHKRISIITDTIQHSITELSHFFFMMIMVQFAYGFFAWHLLGSKLKDFRYYWYAMESMCRMMLVCGSVALMMCISPPHITKASVLASCR
jgi:hypothetical protein